MLQRVLRDFTESPMYPKREANCRRAADSGRIVGKPETGPYPRTNVRGGMAVSLGCVAGMAERAGRASTWRRWRLRTTAASSAGTTSTPGSNR